MRFVSVGVNASLKVPRLGSEFPFVRINLAGHSSDTAAITANRNANTLFNVFFCGSMHSVSLDDNDPNLLAVTSRPPNDAPPLRCCIMRDGFASDPAGIDPETHWPMKRGMRWGRTTTTQTRIR